MRRVLLPVLSLLLVSCQSTDHGTAEQTGYPNLDPLVERVAQARDAQQTALAQFQSTRAQLSRLANVAGADLQASYAATVVEYDAAVEAAVAETGAASPKDMGKVMKAVMVRLAGQSVDGRAVSDAVKKRLAG